MKNITLTILVVLFSFHKIQSQELSLGLKVGGTYSGLYDPGAKNIVNREIRPTIYETPHFNGGILLGVSARLKFAKWFLLELQPHFIQKGGGYTFKDGQPLNDYNIKTNYLEMPVLAIFKPVKWLNLEIGPSIGYQVGYIYKRASLWPEVNTQNYYIQGNRFDISAIIGISFDVLKKFNAGIQYSYSFNTSGYTTYIDINASPIVDSPLDNRYFSFSMKYFFITIGKTN